MAKQTVPLTRRAMIKALAVPGRPRAEVIDIVQRFVGDCPVPPVYTL